MTANSSPGVANQVLRMITDLASQLQQQSAQQGQGVDFGSDNLDSPGVSNQVLNMTANSSPAVANQAERLDDYGNLYVL
jgi:hypothetical protein